MSQEFWPETWEEYSYAVLYGFTRYTWKKSWRRKWFLLQTWLGVEPLKREKPRVP